MADAQVEGPPPRAPDPTPAPAPTPRATPTTSRNLFAQLKSLLMILMSFALTGLVIGNEFYQRQQFYPAVVYITRRS